MQAWGDRVIDVNVFYVYRPIVGKVQLAATIKGMTDGGESLLS